MRTVLITRHLVYSAVEPEPHLAERVELDKIPQTEWWSVLATTGDSPFVHEYARALYWYGPGPAELVYLDQATGARTVLDSRE